MAAGALCAGALLASPARAASSAFCDGPQNLRPSQQDRLLTFTAFITEALERENAPVALVARDGLDLSLIQHRYSHAGLTLRDNPEGPWAVRQLYFSCEEGRPRLFDQGLAGFVMGARRIDRAFVSVVLPPAEAAATLAAASTNNARALAFLHTDYRANAYTFGLRFQNCNQWVAELMAAAWGDATDRPQAQHWLQAQGFEGNVVNAHLRPVLWFTHFSPWLTLEEHPASDLQAAQLRVTLPQSIAAWVQQRYPSSQRLEFCHEGDHMVLRRNGPPFGSRCEAAATDEVRAF